ncbi:golgin subfamily A member 1 isoform X1 [Microcaecilia unicolor]|uniref:Golgin subfamily A member 1 n=1 Tax=Microcaecilia unicolor TaxID=1415580 RepID=A0A6P7YJK1_9AMPH|nr:golgin subfamily A member 1 isoform X1 [Microcaecilia unicolor]XP_030063250.1 golgin subfamily A member 1 isoform X1 [Microcaecilia unicolor]
MFAKLKKKIAEEAAIAPRPGGATRIPRSVSKESITSAGADSGDDFASDGSSSREDLSSQLFRRNEQIRKLEARLSDYAEQVRNLKKTKEKLEIALEKHQDSSMRKLQEQNELYQASQTKMAEGMALALGKKDQEWMEKLADLEKEKKVLSARLKEMKEQRLNLFQKRDELDELEGFKEQELAKVKHMLLKTEGLLTKAKQELEEQRSHQSRAEEELQVASQLADTLKKELQLLQKEHSDLDRQRQELVVAQTSAEKKITDLEQREQELQTFIQQQSYDLQKTEVTASACKERLETLQADYEVFKVQHEQHKHKMMVEAEEKDKLIEHLQEKVVSLEKKLECNFSGDEHVQELLKEKTALEQKLDDTRQQLLEARTNHTEAVSVLESQVTKLNSRVAEGQSTLSQKEEEINNFRESSTCQLRELEQTLQATQQTLAKSSEEISQREAQITRLQADLEAESSKLHQQISIVKVQCAEKVNQLDAQINALETSREFDKTSSKHKINQLEQENEDLKEQRNECETTIQMLEAEQNRLKEELNSRETVSVEIAKALEEIRKQREDLQQQVTDLTRLINGKDQSISEKSAEILQKQEELDKLKEDQEASLLQMQQLQSELEALKNTAAQREATLEKQLSAVKLQLQKQQENLVVLEEEVKALNERLYPSDPGGKEQNGEVAAADIAQLQAQNRELEQQLAEKNKTIKQLQQRMTELKRTLQKELKIKPDNEVYEFRERPGSEPPAASTTVTNNADLNDSREINFEYLKHVVLKFMSCREAEAFHLIKAVSVLLNFSPEEEHMLKETLEYKMSWFGSKPAPKGIIRPSVSSPRMPWS